MATVVSVNISEQKGTQKHPVPEIQLKLHHGIVGDAHAGNWHPKISLMDAESVDNIRYHCHIYMDEVEVTQIGKECHSDCAIKKAVGKCVMPTEGIFAVVVREGTVRPGDEIEVLEAAP